jgi:hypothetical protein
MKDAPSSWMIYHSADEPARFSGYFTSGSNGNFSF